MKWEEFNRSNNVQLDCLKQRASADSPEAEALLKCQDEVVEMRQTLLNGSKSNLERHQMSSLFDGAIVLFLERQRRREREQQQPLQINSSPAALSIVNEFRRQLPVLLLESAIQKYPYEFLGGPLPRKLLE